MMATRVLMLMLVMIAMVTIDVDALATVKFNDSLCLVLHPTAKYCSHGSVYDSPFHCRLLLYVGPMSSQTVSCIHTW